MWYDSSDIQWIGANQWIHYLQVDQQIFLYIFFEFATTNRTYFNTVYGFNIHVKENSTEWYVTSQLGDALWYFCGIRAKLYKQLHHLRLTRLCTCKRLHLIKLKIMVICTSCMVGFWLVASCFTLRSKILQSYSHQHYPRTAKLRILRPFLGNVDGSMTIVFSRRM